MSICTRAFSSPNMNLASCLASNVLPTPVGPAKMKLPIGRFGSFRPARLLRTALAMAVIASCWLMTVLCRSSSIVSRRAVSSLLMRVSGTPVILPTTSRITSSSTTPSISFDLSLHSRVMRSFFALDLVGLVAEVGRLLEVLLGDGRFLLLVELLDLAVHLLEVRRPGHRLEADAGAGLVDHVDGLVRQATAADVAVGQLDGRLQAPRP